MDKKSLLVLLGQTQALNEEICRCRSIARLAVAELAMIPDDAIPDDVREISRMAQQYIRWVYRLDDERPEWYKDEWYGDEW